MNISTAHFICAMLTTFLKYIFTDCKNFDLSEFDSMRHDADYSSFVAYFSDRKLFLM